MKTEVAPNFPMFGKKQAFFSNPWKNRPEIFQCLEKIVLGGLLLLVPGCRPSGAADENVRPPAVAGGFYPADPGELGRMIDAMMAAAKPPPVEGRIRILIVPHAGYVYSGPVAAYGFKAIAGQRYKTVVLVGNSHHEGYEGAAVYARGRWRTPLGDVEIDSDLAQKLIQADPRIVENTGPHEPEHCLEVEVPFLQKTIKSFKIVPVLLGTESTGITRALGDAIAKNIDDDVLVIASTDMSHYPKYEDANVVDGKTAEAILTGSVDTLERTLRQQERMGIPKEVTCLCGEGAVKTVMFVAEQIGARKIQLLKYGNSGDTAGDKGRVVGYSAIAFTSSGEKQAMKKENNEDELNKAEQDELLKLARMTVESVVKTGKEPEYANKLPALDQHRGVFVTLKEHGDLRGCIGQFEPNIPLYQVVMEMAVAAATHDYRFSPVSKRELPDLEYEISVLSPLRKVDSWKEIEIGKHGVEVVRGMHRGVFLPQVATEQGWDLEMFMGTLCEQKAGLPRDAWKEPGTTLYVFTAQVFHENK